METHYHCSPLYFYGQSVGSDCVFALGCPCPPPRTLWLSEVKQTEPIAHKGLAQTMADQIEWAERQQGAQFVPRRPTGWLFYGLVIDSVRLVNILSRHAICPNTAISPPEEHDWVIWISSREFLGLPCLSPWGHFGHETIEWWARTIFAFQALMDQGNIYLRKTRGERRLFIVYLKRRRTGNSLIWPLDDLLQINS